MPSTTPYELPFKVIKDFLDDQKQTYIVDEEEHTCTRPPVDIKGKI